jgi:hypothetical protein
MILIWYRYCWCNIDVIDDAIIRNHDNTEIKTWLYRWNWNETSTGTCYTTKYEEEENLHTWSIGTSKHRGRTNILDPTCQNLIILYECFFDVIHWLIHWKQRTLRPSGLRMVDLCMLGLCADAGVSCVSRHVDHISCVSGLSSFCKYRHVSFWKYYRHTMNISK